MWRSNVSAQWRKRAEGYSRLVAAQAPTDPLLERLSAICLALPEATREDSGRHAGFRVRKRTFAYFLDDHRGDEGIVGVVFKAEPGENHALVSTYPDRFYIPAYIGPRGWAGLRLDRPPVDWDEVADRVTESYLLVAPKRLGASVDSLPEAGRERG
jgi:predicted DNA-binding protein (MmcQ/YjbR family)